MEKGRMSLADKLTYCTVCVNGKMEFQRGTLCGLTDEKPQFVTHCEHFSLDPEKKEKSQRIFSGATSGEEDLVLHPDDKQNNRELDRLTPKTVEVKKSLWQGILSIAIALGAIIYLTPQVLGAEEDKDTLIILGVIIIAISAFRSYQFLSGPRILGVLNKDGFQIKEHTLIRWDEIIAYYVLTEIEKSSNGKKSSKYLVMRVLGKEEVKVWIEDMGISPKQLLSYISLFKYRAENKNHKKGYF